MKRLTAVVLILTVAFSLAGCSTRPGHETEPETGSGPEYVFPGSDKELLPLIWKVCGNLGEIEHIL